MSIDDTAGTEFVAFATKRCRKIRNPGHDRSTEDLWRSEIRGGRCCECEVGTAGRRVFVGVGGADAVVVFGVRQQVGQPHCVIHDIVHDIGFFAVGLTAAIFDPRIRRFIGLPAEYHQILEARGDHRPGENDRGTFVRCGQGAKATTGSVGAVVVGINQRQAIEVFGFGIEVGEWNRVPGEALGALD